MVKIISSQPDGAFHCALLGFLVLLLQFLCCATYAAVTVPSDGRVLVLNTSEQTKAAVSVEDRLPKSARWLFRQPTRDGATKGETGVYATTAREENWWDSLLIVAVGPPHEWRYGGVTYDERKLERCRVEMLDMPTACNDTGIVFVCPSVMDMCQRLGLRTASFSILTPLELTSAGYGLRENWYDKLPESEKWPTKDGERAKDPFDAAGAKSLYKGWIMLLDGTEAPANSPINSHVYMCLNSPYWLPYQVRTAIESLDGGINAIDMDNIIRIPFLTSSDKAGFFGCFCPWCEEKFCEYLRVEHPGLWQEISTAANGEFSIRSYLLNKYFDESGILKPGYYGRPEFVYQDALVKYWLLFQTESYLKFFREYQQAVREYGNARGRIAPFFGNLYVGVQDHILWVWQPASALLAQYCDMIQIEACSPRPPQYRQSVLYELGAAFGNREEPVLVRGRLGEEESVRKIQHDQGHYFRNLQKITISQAYSKGGITELCPMISPNGAWSSVAKSGEVDMNEFFPPEDYIRFVDDNRDILLRQTAVCKVGVVYSVPSFLWHNYPLFSNHPAPKAKALIGITRLLEDAHVPYDVLVFGHPDYLDDAPVLGRIDDYELLFFPDVDCLSVEQCDAIERFLKAGGACVYTGDFCSRDADFNALAGQQAEFLRSRGKRLNVDPTLYTRGPSDLGPRPGLDGFRDFLTREVGFDPGVSIDAPSDVELNVYRHKSLDCLILHLTNYSYDLEQDTVMPYLGLTVGMAWPPEMLVDEISIASPDDVPTGPIPRVIKEGVLQFTVPKLRIWDVISVRYRSRSSPPG